MAPTVKATKAAAIAAATFASTDSFIFSPILDFAPPIKPVSISRSEGFVRWFDLQQPNGRLFIPG